MRTTAISSVNFGSIERLCRLDAVLARRGGMTRSALLRELVDDCLARYERTPSADERAVATV